MLIMMMKSDKRRLCEFILFGSCLKFALAKRKILIEPRGATTRPHSTYNVQKCFFYTLNRSNYGRIFIDSFSQC